MWLTCCLPSPADRAPTGLPKRTVESPAQGANGQLRPTIPRPWVYPRSTSEVRSVPSRLNGSVPVRESKDRSRYPLREIVRASERAPCSAPQTASASALTSALMNVVSIERASRPGYPAGRCQPGRQQSSGLNGPDHGFGRTRTGAGWRRRTVAWRRYRHPCRIPLGLGSLAALISAASLAQLKGTVPAKAAA